MGALGRQLDAAMAREAEQRHLESYEKAYRDSLGTIQAIVIIALYGNKLDSVSLPRPW